MLISSVLQRSYCNTRCCIRHVSTSVVYVRIFSCTIISKNRRLKLRTYHSGVKRIWRLHSATQKSGAGGVSTPRVRCNTCNVSQCPGPASVWLQPATAVSSSASPAAGAGSGAGDDGGGAVDASLSVPGPSPARCRVHPAVRPLSASEAASTSALVFPYKFCTSVVQNNIILGFSFRYILYGSVILFSPYNQ